MLHNRARFRQPAGKAEFAKQQPIVRDRQNFCMLASLTESQEAFPIAFRNNNSKTFNSRVVRRQHCKSFTTLNYAICSKIFLVRTRFTI